MGQTTPYERKVYDLKYKRSATDVPGFVRIYTSDINLVFNLDLRIPVEVMMQPVEDFVHAFTNEFSQGALNAFAFAVRLAGDARQEARNLYLTDLQY